MKKQNSTGTDFGGIALIFLAIVAGIFVANALYNWEANARAKVAASSQVRSSPTPQVSKPAQVSPASGEQVPGKAAETKPAPKETIPADSKSSASPRAEVVTPKPEGTTTTDTPTAQVSFKQDVLPIFQKNCGFCHGAMGGLDLKDYKSLMTMGNNKPQVIPGKPQESLLVKRMEEKPIMPPSGPVPASDMQKIKQWITEGAKDN